MSGRILLGHGSGGRLSRELVEEMILPALGAEPDGGVAASDGGVAAPLEDAALIDIHEKIGGADASGGLVDTTSTSTIAMTTDSYVVDPIFFPGGCIGDLAVNGTVNDLAMMGAAPQWLTLALVIEEGLPFEELAEVLAAIRRRADEAGVRIVTGDTKVVDRGKADRLFINTSGVGLVPAGRSVSAGALKIGDRVIVSGPVADHGIAVLSKRAGIEFSTPVESDTAPLAGLVGQLLASGADIHALRDPTRGGLATTLNELAAASGAGIEIEEEAVPIRDETLHACELLGLDPLLVANEGRLVMSVAPDDADRALAVMLEHPYGKGAAIIGEVTSDHRAAVVMRTRIGGRRIIDILTGEQLPRIC